MPFRDIPRRRWSRFLERFSGQHRGCECSLQVIAGGALAARSSPFQGAAFESRRERAQIQIFVGDRPEAHVCHSVSQPISISVETTGDGSDKGLRITTDDRSVLLRFRAPQPSESGAGV